MGDDSGTPSESRARLRCFWAALPDARSQRLLDALVAQLRAAGCEGWRWIPRTNWHLTLLFLGPTSEAQVAALGTALRQRSLPAPLTLALREIAPFPRSRPRTLAARLETSAALRDWVGYLRERAAVSGFQTDDRTFRAHLTVARPRRGRSSRLPQLVERGPLCFDRIALMRSDLGASGAVYRPLAVLAAGSSLDLNQ